MIPRWRRTDFNWPVLLQRLSRRRGGAALGRGGALGGELDHDLSLHHHHQPHQMSPFSAPKTSLFFNQRVFSRTIRTGHKYICIFGSLLRGLSQGIPPTFLIRTNQPANIPVLRDIILFVMESNTKDSLNKVGQRNESTKVSNWRIDR